MKVCCENAKACRPHGEHFHNCIEDGAIRQLEFHRQKCASYMAFSQDRRTLFVILEGCEFGGLASYSVAEDGSLEKRSELLTPFRCIVGRGCPSGQSRFVDDATNLHSLVGLKQREKAMKITLNPDREIVDSV